MISSTGGAAHHQGHALGQFEYDVRTRLWIQSSTEHDSEAYEPSYLYPDSDGTWFVNNKPGESAGVLLNPTPSKEIPTSGWLYADPSKEPWQEDPSLIITSGPLPSLCSQYIVSATGAAAERYPECMGVFNRTERWWLGRPVFVNTQGLLLHHGYRDFGWGIGNLDDFALRGSRSHQSPDSERNWKYYTGTGTGESAEYKPADVTVTRSNLCPGTHCLSFKTKYWVCC